MQIVLYDQSIALDHMARSMTGAVTLTGYLREACDIIAPDIQVNYNSAILSKNYAYIADFGRYYYFRKPPTIEGDVIELHLYADALYNYRNEILNANCIAERSSSHYNLYLPDNAILEEEGYIYHTGVLPYTFKPNNGSYILTVCGGN